LNKYVEIVEMKRVMKIGRLGTAVRKKAESEIEKKAKSEKEKR